LLVRWLQRLRRWPGPTDLDIAFVPISIRFETSRPAIFWEALARQLATFAGEQISAPAGDAATFYADQFGRLLEMREAEAGARRLLVVVDGIDEATAPGFRVEVLPVILPAKVRMVFSARLLAGDADWRGWRDRLDWSTGTRVRSLDLPRLDQDGIADVLVRLGAPGDELARDRVLVRELLRLIEGEPLLGVQSRSVMVQSRP
jgi:hypothetical protein